MPNPAPKSFDLALLAKLAAELPAFASLIGATVQLVEDEKAATSNLQRVKLAQPVIEAAAQLSDEILAIVKAQA